MLNAKNGRLHLAVGDMDYVRFGAGEKVLVMIPGVGDGLKTVKGTALPFAILYRSMAKDFTVYMFSRRAELPAHMTTREMAEDLNLAMDALGLTGVSGLGVSQGGMIAQWLAIDHPERVARLILTVTLARPNPTMLKSIELWSDMARRGDYKGIMLDTAEKSYTPERFRKEKLAYALLGSVGKPRSFDRFLTQAEACAAHDAWEELPRIQCPTLIIGGTKDAIVTGAASEEMAERIPGSRLYMYEGLSHGLYEEAPDFLQRVMDFCS